VKEEEKEPSLIVYRKRELPNCEKRNVKGPSKGKTSSRLRKGPSAKKRAEPKYRQQGGKKKC